MQVLLDRRAEISFRSLGEADRVKVQRVLDRLGQADAAVWNNAVQAQRMHVFDGEMLYSIRAGNNIRLLSKVLSGVLIIQDIFPRERLERISGLKL